MTEAEWIACTDPQPMLEFLRGRASERKLRLFAVACCRRIWHLLMDERSRKAVEVAEQFADGQVTDEGRAAAEDESWTAVKHLNRDETVDAASVDAADTAYGAAFAEADDAASYTVDAALRGAEHAGVAARIAEQNTQCNEVRDIFGPILFRSVILNPSWLSWHGGLLVSMARRMYDSRDFADLPVLADALEEAGCQDQDILGHCRSESEHVRGCWVIDLLLGKN